MRIYKMTATFGKLENQTLTLEPGLNIFTAPNEWGKSTWCAFLMAMFYGVDTAERTKKAGMANKERFAPWSGSPMEGRIDLCWNGRDITIQRQTKKRVPMGEFLAYETESGLPVPELTAANCGQKLLGVEQSVFRRAGFIRQADLPVTQDEALRRRLNSLVTTGDESGSGDRLAENLKNLKNKCRFNRSGLLPQAEAQKSSLEDRLAELDTLQAQQKAVEHRLEELKTWRDQLNNHLQALAYAGSAENEQRMVKARNALDQARQERRELEKVCSRIPSRQEAEDQLRDIKNLREQWNALQKEQQALPQLPQPPQLREPFVDMSLEEAAKMVQADAGTFQSAVKTKLPFFLLLLGILGLIGAGVLIYLQVYIPGAIAAVTAAAAMVWGLFERKYYREQARTLAKKYGSVYPDTWGLPLGDFARQQEQYRADLKAYQDASGDLDVRHMMLTRKWETLCDGQEIDTAMEFCQQIIIQQDVLEEARREEERAKSHYETLRDLVKPVEKPGMPDSLTCSEPETAQLLTDAATEQQRLQNRKGQLQGRMEALGNRETMEKDLAHCLARLSRLEDTYSALSIALETLADARAELQRRFAPRIARKAQSFLEQLTQGRYRDLTMGTDFTLQASAGSESTLRDLQWRSDGTIDQVYLALRLAVAEELTPDVPLVLDDALVRFDDDRMAAAVDILRVLSETRQILFFTCQNRESSV